MISEHLVFLSFISLLSALCFISYWVPQAIIPIIIKNSSRWQILDQPTIRKIHLEPIPRMGGLSIAPALWLTCSICLIITHSWPEVFNMTSSAKSFSLFVSLFLGSIGMFIIGAIDDAIRLRARHKFFGQLVVISICISFFPIPHSIGGFEADHFIMKSIMITWLVMIPNSVNLLDGIDGLTATLGVIFSAVVSAIAVLSGEYLWLSVTLPLSFSLLSFLKFNWHPAKIFLGDSGSLLIGFWIGALSLYFALDKNPNSLNVNWNPWISLGLTTIWLIDTIWAIARRYLSMAPSRKILTKYSKKTYLKHFRNAIWNIFNPDDNHIHHRLLKVGFKVPQAVAILAANANIFFIYSISLKFLVLENNNFHFYMPLVFLALAASTTTFLIAMLFAPSLPQPVNSISIPLKNQRYKSVENYKQLEH